MGEIGTIKSVQFTTETGEIYKMTRMDDSVHYYKNEELITVRDTGPNYTSENLLEACVKIAAKYNVPKEKLLIIR